MKKIKKLIINADDWGLSPLFNKGILELVEEGIVTSISVMINHEYIEPKNLLTFPKISIGLHLELGKESEISEIENQVEKFKQLFNRFPSHLDGHQHCHILPGNIENVIAVAKKHSLPVRSRFSEDREFFIKNGIKTPGLFLSWHPKRAEEFIEKIKNINVYIAEIVCHPGHFDENCDYLYNKQREQEFKFLKSPKLLSIISKFKLISYYEL